MSPKPNSVDPYAEREAQKYDRPIASRERILEVLHGSSGPLDLDALAQQLNLQEATDHDALKRRLRAMERDGQIIRNRRKAYLPVDQQDLIRGRVLGNANGFGFLAPEEGGEDLFLSPREMRSLLHGDRAVVRLVGVDKRGRKEGAVVEVLERHNHQAVGRLFKESGIAFVVLDNKRLHQDVLIPAENVGSAEAGQIVSVAIIEQPSRHTQPIGRVIEILGDHMAPGMEVDIAVRSHGLPYEWPAEVEAEAHAFDAQVPESAVEGRMDLRQAPLVTIDGEDAMDFDDAVYCEPADNGWRLLVAIADVSAYVRVDSALDQEAQNRATSVYFPGRVIPMLPEALSNGLCSLNPHVDRLCMVCEMGINARGELTGYEFHEAVMRSAARLTYTEVAAMITERTTEARRGYPQLVPHLDHLQAVYQALRQARARRGAIDFETTETQFVFGDDQKIANIVPSERNEAHKLIEECMIAANVAAARYLLKHQMPALYRVHDGPSADKLADLRTFLGELGLTLGGGDDPEPMDYTELMATIANRTDAHLIQTVLLRSLAQAVYQPDNRGHFGLALEAYAHFTSPIRRYPDLLVHRAIRHLIRRGQPAAFSYTHDQMTAFGEQCSMAERRADEATREVADWLKCEYVMDRVGEDFDGVVSTVTSFGLFVELSAIYVEGLVHITALANDFYHFDAVGHRLEGERSGRVYRLGDPLRVRVVRVDLDERKIDFELVDGEKGRKPRNKKGKSKSPRG